MLDGQFSIAIDCSENIPARSLEGYHTQPGLYNPAVGLQDVPEVPRDGEGQLNGKGIRKEKLEIGSF